jgi:hypothetical protein
MPYQQSGLTTTVFSASNAFDMSKRTTPQQQHTQRLLAGGRRAMRIRRLGAALDLPTDKADLRDLAAQAAATHAITKCPTRTR